MSEEERKLVENNIVFKSTLVEITPELMKKTIIEQDKEIERLNNIINELEKWLEERYDICKKNIDKMEYNEYSHNFYQVANNVNADRKDTLNKLQELKDSDKE